MTIVMRNPEPNRWEVGTFEVDETGDIIGFHNFMSFIDHSQAIDFVHWLNGGMRQSESESIVRALESVAERLDRIWRCMGRLQ